jgi:hypothetical protein
MYDFAIPYTIYEENFLFFLISVSRHVNDIGDKESWKIHWSEPWQERCKNITETAQQHRIGLRFHDIYNTKELALFVVCAPESIQPEKEEKTCREK